MYVKYDTPEEASAALTAQWEIKPDWFCPLSNSMCNLRCVCLGEPRLVRSGNAFLVYRYRCTNEMFFAG